MLPMFLACELAAGANDPDPTDDASTVDAEPESVPDCLLEAGVDSAEPAEAEPIRDGQAEMVKPALRDPERWGGARCNDGTPFGMDVVLAPEPSATWVLFLGPGASCDDNADPCDERAVELTTTPAKADGERYDFEPGGIFSGDDVTNPTFSKANRVYAQYCSSDLWTGDTTELRPTAAVPDPKGGWYFSGHANVDAMLEILVERFGLDDEDPALRVLFTGSSAGGLGAHFNARRAAACFPETVEGGRFQVLVDAGWMVAWDDEAYRDGNATESDLEVRRHAREFWGGTFDAVCELEEEADPASCFFGETWYPYLAQDLDVLVQQSGTDAAFTADHGIRAGDREALDAWGDAVSDSYSDVAWLFSGQESYHTLAFRDAGLEFGPPGSKFGDVLGRFWAGDEPERVIFGKRAGR